MIITKGSIDHPAPRSRIRATLTKGLPLLGAGLLTAICAGCGNGVVASGSASQPDLSSPSAGSSASAVASPGGAGSDSPSASDSASPSPSGSSSSSSSRSGSGSGSGSTSRATSSSHSSPTQSATKSTGSTGNARSTCTLGDLSVGVKDAAGGGTAGSAYVLLTFTNTSNSSCAMYGYPGVSFVGDGNGTQLGAAAIRSQNTAHTVELAPGKQTTALLRIADAGAYDASTCAPTTSDGFRIYPPNSTTSAYVPFKTQACQRTGGKQLEVSPVGTSG